MAIGKGLFNDKSVASAQSMAEAARMDEVQRLFDDGLYDRARVALDSLLADGSDHPQAALLKARLYVQAGDAEHAIPWCGKAIAGSPAWIEPRYLLARIYLDLKRYAAAGSVFEDVDRLAPWDAYGPYGMAAVAAMRGDPATAERHLAVALQRNPDHESSLELGSNLAHLAGDGRRERDLLTRLAAQRPMDADIPARLGALAQAAGNLSESAVQYARAYQLSPRPTTAAKLAELARLGDDQAAAARWSALAGQQATDSGTTSQ